MESESPASPSQADRGRLVGRVVVLDDDSEYCRALSSLLTEHGCTVETASNAEAAVALVRTFAPDILLTDVRMPGVDGFSVMEAAHRQDPRLAVVMMTGYATVPDAVRAMRAGAEYYVAKPVAPAELLAVARSVLHRRRREAVGPRGRLPAGARPEGLVGGSEPMRALLGRVALVAPTKTTVLLLGETGTGKERIAEAIHAASHRAGGQLVRVNCGALPETLLESELFGHEKGAFTGAHARREGRFKLADGGTIFLDEIGDISPSVQVKLLRVLQERQFERVGGNETLSVDVRVIAATHRDLRAMVAAGTFRADLYYRLCVMALEVPPLRARKDDIPPLVEHTLARLSRASGAAPATVTSEVMRMLTHHEWPGNVRELENVIERAYVLARGRRITAAELAPGLTAGGTRGDAPALPGATFMEIERHAILSTYEGCGRNALRTAAILGISPRTVHYRLREYRGEAGRRLGRAGELARPARSREH